MNYLLDDLMEFEKTADRKIRYDHQGKTMFLELAGSSDTEENIKMYLDGAKRSGMKAQVVPWDTPYDKPKAGQEKVAMPVFNEEATRSRNFLPGVPEALEKVKEAEATKNKVLKPYNEAQPAINVLKQRFEKNQARLSRAESQEWARDRLRSSGRSLNRLTKNRPVPIGPMSEAMEKDWDPTGVRKNIKHWGQEYKKSFEKNPNDIKHKNHYEKQMDLSERLLERAKKNAPLTKDMMSATNERSDAGKQYRLARGAYNTKREQNSPAVSTPPKDIFFEGWKLSLKKDMQDLGRKTREDIEQMHQETLNDFAKSRAERKQKMMEDIDRGAQETLDNLAKSRADQKQETEQAVKTPFSRNKALGLGVGLAGTAAALGGGAYLYNRYKKKKREQAEQEKTANAAWRKPASPSTKEEYETERKKLRKNLIRSAVGATAGLALSRIPYGKITDQAKRRDWEKVVKNSTPENFEAIRDKHSIFSRRMNDVAMYAPLPGKMITAIGAGNLMNNAYRAAHLKLKYGKRFDGMQDQEKTAGDVVDFASHAKKIADRNALKAKFVNPEDPIRKAQSAIQEYLDKEKEQQAESEMRWSKINDLQASIDSDMEQLRKMDEQEAKVKLRSKKINKGVGIAGAGLATIGGGAYLYNRYKKKKRAQAEQEKTASDGKTGGLLTAGGIGLTAASLYGSLAMQKRLKKKYGDIDGVNETSFLSGIGNDRASNRIYATKEQMERAKKFKKSFNRLNFGSRVGFGVGSGLSLMGASMLADAVSKKNS